MANKKRTQNKRNKRSGKKQRRRTAAKQRGGNATYTMEMRFNNGTTTTTKYNNHEALQNACDSLDSHSWSASIRHQSGNNYVCIATETAGGM
jgi:hypothetical protein